MELPLIKELFKSREFFLAGHRRKSQRDSKHERVSAQGRFLHYWYEGATGQGPENSLWKLSELPGQPAARQQGPKSHNLELNSANNLRELEVDLSLVEPPVEDTAG